jgi:hypothetical protein
MAKTCRNCPSTDLVPNGDRFRNVCHKCHAEAQRKAWRDNRAARLIASRASYAKHARTRRQEAATYKAANPEYYALAEWFRKKRIPISHIDRADISALVEMKRAVKAAKAAAAVA